MEIQTVKISTLKENEENPRYITEGKFKKLVQSILDLPQMLDIRPIVVNSDMVVLGGNMRLKACKEAGLKEVPIIIADDLSEEQQAEFIIKDNVGFGSWDWEALSNKWDNQLLNEWGMDVPEFSDIDYSDKNKEIDINNFGDKMVLKLEYTEEEYFKVKELLLQIAETPEQAIWKLLGNE